MASPYRRESLDDLMGLSEEEIRRRERERRREEDALAVEHMEEFTRQFTTPKAPPPLDLPEAQPRLKAGDGWASSIPTSRPPGVVTGRACCGAGQMKKPSTAPRPAA